MSAATTETARRGAGDRETAAAADGDATSPRRLRASHGFVTIGVAVSLVAVIAGVLFGSGNADQLVDLLPGRAWLANDERGSVTLVNGATGEAEFEMRFTGAGGDEFEVVQGDEGVFVVNRSTGEITRIDGATQTIAGSIRVDVGDEPLFLIGGGRAYLVLKAIGTIQEIDPQSPNLAPVGDPVPLGAAIGSAVVDDEGVIAAAVLGSGEVVFVEGASIAGKVALNPPGDPLTVTLVEDTVVAVAQDVRAGTVEASSIGPGGVQRTQAVDVPATGEIAIAPKMDGDRLWLLHTDTATLAGVPLDGGEVRTLKLAFAKGEKLGAPLPNGSFVYIPNFDQGALLKVDAETGAFVDVVPVGEDTEEFEAFVENGRVWGNDPVGGSAVVIDRDGNVSKVEKYAPGIPTNDGNGIPVPLDLDKPVGAQVPGERLSTGEDDATDPKDSKEDPGPDPQRPAPSDDAISGPIVPVGPVLVDPAVPNLPLIPGVPGTLGSSPLTPIVPPVAGVPGVPGAVSAAGGDASAAVSWLPALANGSVITAYRITASTGATQSVDGTTTSVTFTGLANDTPVSFSVRAENAIGLGPEATSNTITPVKAIPGAPTSVDFRLTQPTFQVAVVTVSWDLPVENPASVASWAISCSSSAASTNYGFTAAAGARSMTLDTLPPNESYFCGIWALTADSTVGPDVTMASGSTLTPLQAPPPPSCSVWSTVNRIDPSQDPVDAYAIQCSLVAPSTSLPITGYLWDIYDGVSFAFHGRTDASTTWWVSDRIPSPTDNKMASLYSYYTDPISGLTVTSTAWTHVA